MRSAASSPRRRSRLRRSSPLTRASQSRSAPGAVSGPTSSASGGMSEAAAFRPRRIGIGGDGGHDAVSDRNGYGSVDDVSGFPADMLARIEQEQLPGHRRRIDDEADGTREIGRIHGPLQRSAADLFGHALVLRVGIREGRAGANAVHANARRQRLRQRLRRRPERRLARSYRTAFPA